MKLDAQLLAAEYLQNESNARPVPQDTRTVPQAHVPQLLRSPPAWAIALSDQLGAVRSELAQLRAELVRQQEPDLL